MSSIAPESPQVGDPQALPQVGETQAPPQAAKPTSKGAPTTNHGRWSTKQLVVMALMTALAILLSFASFAIIPAAPFLKLDFALVPISIVGLAYGPGSGVMVGLACAFAHAAITGNWVGAIMSSIVALAYVIPVAVLYGRNRTLRGAALSLTMATLNLTIWIIAANLVIDPLLYGMAFDKVMALVIPAILPFNIIKGVAVSVLVALVYKSISNLITPAKNQVRGRKAS